nr:RNA-directed DNA polymerase, eukaryota [Tanacetum cinerariifolium]
MIGSGVFRVKDVRCMLDDFFLPRDEVATRWLPHLPIKLNVFAWRLYLDRLPTKSNLIRRGIQVSSPSCSNCNSFDEDVSHIFFKCPLAIEVSRAVCRPRRTFKDAVGRLTAYEERIKSQDTLEANDQDKLLMASSNSKSYEQVRVKELKTKASSGVMNVVSMDILRRNARNGKTKRKTEQKAHLIYDTDTEPILL